MVHGSWVKDLVKEKEEETCINMQEEDQVMLREVYTSDKYLNLKNIVDRKHSRKKDYKRKLTGKKRHTE
jgi:hypothetical protein